MVETVAVCVEPLVVVGPDATVWARPAEAVEGVGEAVSVRTAVLAPDGPMTGAGPVGPLVVYASVMAPALPAPGFEPDGAEAIWVVPTPGVDV